MPKIVKFGAKRVSELIFPTHFAFVVLQMWPGPIALLLLCLSLPAVTAQTAAPSENKASLAGNVTGPDGAIVVGANVKLTVRANAAAGAVARVQTDENGHYEFQKVEPGIYMVAVEAAGFKMLEKQVLLKPKDHPVQDFILQVATLSEKVEVMATEAPVSTESSSAPVALVTNSQLVTLPTAQEKVKEVIPVTPGVVQTLDSKLVFKGSDENQSLLIINSTRNTDPVTGSFGITVPTDVVESFAVYKTPYDASLGSFSGGLTTIQTKPPNDAWDWNVTKLGITVLGKEGHTAGLGGATPAMSLDYPLIKHKLLFAESFQYEMKKTTVEGLAWPHDISKRQGFNSFTSLEAILSKNHILNVTLNAFPLRTDHIDISALVPQTASNNLNQRGVALAVSDRYLFDSGSVLSTIAQYTRFDSSAHGQGTDDMLITPQGWDGNFFNLWSRRAKELQFLTNYEFAKKQWLGTHEIRIGADIDWRSYFGTTSSHPIQILRADDSLAETITFGGTPRQDTSDTIVAEFVQDHWLPFSRLNVDLGLRLSTETSGWPAAVAPRVGIAYSPDKNERTVIRAGAGLFYGVLPLLAATWAENPTRTITQFDATGLQTGPAITYTNAYAANLNPLASPLPSTTPDTSPRNLTYNLGVVQKVNKDMQVEFSYLNSHTSYLFSIQPFTAALPTDPSFTALTNTGSSRYHELETSLHFHFKERDEIKASYIYSRSRGDENSLSNLVIPFEAPVIRPDVYGISPSDIPHRVIAWGIFAIPWQMTLSPLIDVHSGFPYSPIDATQQYVGAPNSQRFPVFFSLDFKAYRTFRIPFLKSNSGKTHHFRLGAYSINVTNHGNFNAVFNNVTSPNFGQFVGLLYRHEGLTLDFID